MIGRLIVYAIIIYLIIRLIKSFYPSQKISRDSESSGGEHMVKDPNCNSYIPEREAVKGRVRGEVLSFCSKECLEEYRTRKRG